jgi:16S rRNA processing protein RimM
MTKDDCYQVGHITKTHGVRGELVLFLDVDDASAYGELDSVLLDIRGELVPYFVESMALVKDSRAIVAFEDVDTIEQAERLIGSEAWLPVDNLEPITDETRFYFHEIIGYRVVDAVDGELGLVDVVYTMATQDLISMIHEGKEVLIPINSEIVRRVDRANRRMEVALPDGLLAIYMTPDAGRDADTDEDDTDTDETPGAGTDTGDKPTADRP